MQPLLQQSQLFGVSISLASVTFNKVCRVLVATLYNRFVKLTRTDEEWEVELKGFSENYDFSCLSDRDGFHVYFSSKLKPYFSFKKRYVKSRISELQLEPQEVPMMQGCYVIPLFIKK